MKIRKSLIIVFVFCLVLIFVSCGSKTNNAKSLSFLRGASISLDDTEELAIAYKNPQYSKMSSHYQVYEEYFDLYSKNDDGNYQAVKFVDKKGKEISNKKFDGMYIQAYGVVGELLVLQYGEKIPDNNMPEKTNGFSISYNSNDGYQDRDVIIINRKNKKIYLAKDLFKGYRSIYQGDITFLGNVGINIDISTFDLGGKNYKEYHASGILDIQDDDLIIKSVFPDGGFYMEAIYVDKYNNAHVIYNDSNSSNDFGVINGYNYINSYVHHYMFSEELEMYISDKPTFDDYVAKGIRLDNTKKYINNYELVEVEIGNGESFSSLYDGRLATFYSEVVLDKDYLGIKRKYVDGYLIYSGYDFGDYYYDGNGNFVKYSDLVEFSINLSGELYLFSEDILLIDSDGSMNSCYLDGNEIIYTNCGYKDFTSFSYEPRVGFSNEIMGFYSRMIKKWYFEEHKFKTDEYTVQEYYFSKEIILKPIN